MKKITKLGVLSLALAGCLVALNVNAGTGDDTKQVSLTLTAGNNTCTIENYNFGSHEVLTVDRELNEMTGAITCTFLENAAKTVTLSLADLTSTAGTIAKTNFTMAVAAAGHTGQIADLSATSTTTFSDTAITIYTKTANVLGSWASTLTIDGTIPGGTAAGEYQGDLNLVIQ